MCAENTKTADAHCRHRRFDPRHPSPKALTSDGDDGFPSGALVTPICRRAAFSLTQFRTRLIICGRLPFAAMGTVHGQAVTSFPTMHRRGPSRPCAMAVSDADLEQALRSMARIIDRYGDVYWPIFERLETELSERRTRSARLAAYRADAPSVPAAPGKGHPISVFPGTAAPGRSA